MQRLDCLPGAGSYAAALCLLSMSTVQKPNEPSWCLNGIYNRVCCGFVCSGQAAVA